MLFSITAYYDNYDNYDEKQKEMTPTALAVWQRLAPRKNLATTLQEPYRRRLSTSEHCLILPPHRAASICFHTTSASLPDAIFSTCEATMRSVYRGYFVRRLGYDCPGPAIGNTSKSLRWNPTRTL